MAESICIVDDDFYICDSFSKILLEEGYSIDTYDDGRTAYAALMGEKYDILLIDYHLKGMSISEIISRLKMAEVHTSIIIMTGDYSKTTENDARALGPDFFFTKPFEIEDLMKVIDSIRFARMNKRIQKV